MTSHPVGPDEFRGLLGSFATGVTVATTRTDDGDVSGMTVSAVASVSLVPPLLLVCIEHDTEFFDAMCAVPAFALSVLAADQRDIAERFAGTYATRFDGVHVSQGTEGMPLIDGASAHIVCRRWNVAAAGDHSVFIGLVVGGVTFARPPLLHFRGAYRTLGGDLSPQ